MRYSIMTDSTHVIFLKVLLLAPVPHINIIIRYWRELMLCRSRISSTFSFALISSRLLQSGYFDVLSTTLFISFASDSIFHRHR